MPNLILKSFTPALDNNLQHKSWVNTKFNSTMYVFVVTFEGDEQEYEANSKSTTPNWKIGEEYIDGRQAKPSNSNYLPKCSLKSASFNANQGSKSTYNNPENVKRVSMSVAQSVATSLYKLFGKPGSTNDILQLSDLIYEWVIKVKIDRDICSLRHNAMLRMIDMYGTFGKESFSKIQDHENFNQAVYAMCENICDKFMMHLEKVALAPEQNAPVQQAPPPPPVQQQAPPTQEEHPPTQQSTW